MHSIDCKSFVINRRSGLHATMCGKSFLYRTVIESRANSER